MTVAGASTLWASNDGTRAPEELRRLVYVSANLIHRLLPTLLVGAETLWGRATRVDGVTATNARLQLTRPLSRPVATARPRQNRTP